MRRFVSTLTRTPVRSRRVSRWGLVKKAPNPSKVAPRLPERLGRFYGGLLASEARHFEHYIAFARSECGIDPHAIDTRLDELKAVEAALITEPDEEFRFHSGSPR